jgi:hypothetical protein
MNNQIDISLVKIKYFKYFPLVYLAVIFAFGKFSQTPLHSVPHLYIFEANRHLNSCPISQSATGI